MICDNLAVADNGHLEFGGYDTVALAEKYSTPLYVMDEPTIRKNAAVYLDALRENFGENALPLFASKAASFKKIYRIIAETGMGADVVSSGELYTAKCAGFPMEKLYFHGNNKTDEDIRFAIESGLGCFVVDSVEELKAIDRIAGEMGVCQKILLRLTPGIDPHTYEAVATGQVDSKFGAAIETGAAEEITSLALSMKNLKLAGFHCHVGSQVFDSEVFFSTSEIMMQYIADMQKKYGFITEELNLGGGYGVRYIESDPHIDIAANIRQVADVLKSLAKSLSIKLPKILMEPGRSIVADAGITLYTIGSVKCIPEYKNYVSIDGGMTDNPRFALYGSSYTVVAANHADKPCEFNCSVVGRCCESGDIIQENVVLPNDLKRGDIIAVLTTGAYNYSMASNYNRIPRPPIVMLSPEGDSIAVKRETLEDIISCDR